MKLTPEKLTAFCAALSETCNVGKACTAVGISRFAAYQWRREIPEFAERWEEAMQAGVTGLEDEAHRRAFEGVDDPLVHQGQFTHVMVPLRDEQGDVVRGEDGTPRMVPKLDEKGEPVKAAVRKYSDTLAIFLLKAHNPDRYRENSKVELSGSLEVKAMSDADLDAAIALEMARQATETGLGAAISGGEGDGSDLV